GEYACVAAFSKVLVANRGEIAVRIFRTLRELGIATVAVYSEADRGALHVRVADEAFLVGPGPATESYLVQERLIETAHRAGVGAGRGGGGGASAQGGGSVGEPGGAGRGGGPAALVGRGPPPAAMELMGSKTAARAAMRAAAVPIIPGTTEPVSSADGVRRLG